MLNVFAFALALFALQQLAWSEEASPVNEPAKPTLWLVGDSTVKVGTKGQQGWGDPIKDLFDASKISVENRARGGRSSRTFIREGLWDEVLKDAKPGDFVIVQLGHNDGGPLAGDNRERGSIRGIGDESEEVTLTTGQKETVRTYGWYLRKYVKDARDKGLTPILASYIPRCPKPGSKIEPNPEPTSYRLHTQQIAEQEKVPYIDLYAIIWSKYVGQTPEDLKSKYFCEADFTHTSPDGAKLNAECVVEGIKQLNDVALKNYLK